MALTSEQKELVFTKLRERIAKAATEEKIDNSKLYAGSSMYFYCKLCGLLADVLPESYITPPRKHCEDCGRLFKEYGLTMEEVQQALAAPQEESAEPRPAVAAKTKPGRI